MHDYTSPRRRFIRSSVLGLFGVTITKNLSAQDPVYQGLNPAGDALFYRYPAMNDEMIYAVVGAAHTDLEKVKGLVDKRPELANATWDWGFGDIESALGAASHMGRKDIADYLVSKGARPDIFTMAMLGELESLKNIISTFPGVQSVPGPHGITLMAHARSRLRFSDLPDTEKEKINQTIAYLEKLGMADNKAVSLPVTEEEQKQYLGEYRFGKKEDEVFVVDINSRKLLQISRKGTFGRVLNRTGDHTFSPGGAASVTFRFNVAGGKAVSLSVHEPEPLVTAVRI